MTREQAILTVIVLPLLALAELVIFFWPKKKDIKKWRITWTGRRVLTYAYIWKPMTMVVLGIVGVIGWGKGLYTLEPHGYCPFNGTTGDIKAISILPATYGSLLQDTISLEKPEIEQVFKALRKGRRMSPKHPPLKWQCKLRLETTWEEAVTLEVWHSGGNTNGVIVYWNSPNLEFCLVTYRCDELGPLLEAIVDKRGKGGSRTGAKPGDR